MVTVATESDLLQQAIARRLIAGFCVPNSFPEREWKVRLLKAEDGEDGFWAQPVDSGYAKSSPPAGSEVEVSFNPGHSRSCFRSTLLRHDKHFWLNEQMMVEAVLLKWPDAVTDGERRQHPRYPVSDDSHIHAQLCVTSGAAFGIEIPAKMMDMSLGGAGFVAALRCELRHVQEGDTLRAQIHHLGQATEIYASFTDHRSISGNNAFKFGVRFEPDSAKWAPRAREAVDAIVADLARRESLRAKARAAK